MARHVFKPVKWAVYGSLFGGTVGGITAYLQRNHLDVGTIGFVRFGRAAIACGSVVVDYKRTLRNLDVGTEEYAEMLSKVHRRSAERLRACCCVNRGCYIKIGQHIGALDYLLPDEYVETFRVLHSSAPQTPIAELEEVFKQETGKQFSDVFSYIDTDPCGTASLAQVHRAKLHDGTIVAVKIQHPQVRDHSFIDIKTMETLTHLVSKIFPKFEFVWLSEESKRNLPLELDFYNEACNCERVAHMFQHFKFVKVPKINWALTTERVLTMEFCEGGHINDKSYFVKHNIDVLKVAEMLTKLYSEMIFVEGYVHCDPHPGNLLVHKSKEAGTQIVLLDHGLYATLSDTFRLNYCRLWEALLSADLPNIKRQSAVLGLGTLYPLFACMVTGRTWNNVTSGMEKVAASKEEDEEIKDEVGNFFAEITQILNTVPREMLLIFKTNDLLRGIEQNLKTRTNAYAFLIMGRACLRGIYNYEVENCASWVRWLELNLLHQWQLLRISLLQLVLWFNTKPDQRDYN